MLAVHLGVLSQVVGAREALAAGGARVRPHARVRARVSGELVAAGEPPAAATPQAGERLLTSVAAQVCLQVRRLGVLLAAARVRTGKALHKV